MRHKVRIIFNYDGTLWYEIEAESVTDLYSEISKVEKCDDFFKRSYSLMKKGFAYFESESSANNENIAYVTSPDSTPNELSGHIKSENYG